MRFASLFAGIGGFELGLSSAGHSPALVCEILPAARAVLAKRFSVEEFAADVCQLRDLPADVELVTAGFPCQDLSQAGQTIGIGGARSSLVSEVFRLAAKSRPQWIVLENVPFMLHLKRGEAIKTVTSHLEALGYQWAWRVVDTFGFGLPQRRERVFIVASRSADPANVLLSDDAPFERPPTEVGRRAHGFYWTEGRTGLGWAPDAVPTLKNGSAIGIPSPPAVLLPSGQIIKPDIRDAERLQGFPADWTLPAVEVARASMRWSLVGSAVSVPVSQWLGNRLAAPGTYDVSRDRPLDWSRSLPRAARSAAGSHYAVDISRDPVGVRAEPLAEFLNFPGVPLSERAASSFLARTRKSSLRFDPAFTIALEEYVDQFAASERAKAA